MNKFDKMFDKYLEEMSTDSKESKKKVKVLCTEDGLECPKCGSDNIAQSDDGSSDYKECLDCGKSFK